MPKPREPVVEIKFVPTGEVMKKSVRAWVEEAITEQLARKPTIDDVAIISVRVRKVDQD